VLLQNPFEADEKFIPDFFVLRALQRIRNNQVPPEPSLKKLGHKARIKPFLLPPDGSKWILRRDLLEFQHHETNRQPQDSSATAVESLNMLRIRYLANPQKTRGRNRRDLQKIARLSRENRGFPGKLPAAFSCFQCFAERRCSCKLASHGKPECHE